MEKYIRKPINANLILSFMDSEHYINLLGMPRQMIIDGLNGLCSEKRSRTYVDSLDRMIACHPTLADIHGFIDENRKEYGEDYEQLRSISEELLQPVIDGLKAERIISREELATNPTDPDMLKRH